MEANSNISDHQGRKLPYKFISEERLNYITQRVHYDKKKKLEDEAWLNFLARKDKSGEKYVNEKPQPISHLEVTDVLDTRHADSGEWYCNNFATNLHQIELVRPMPSDRDAYSTLKHCSANDRTTMDYVMVNKDPIQEERLLHETSHTICIINNAGLEQLKSIWLKILLHLNGIVCLYAKAQEQENSEEYLLHQIRAAEFTALFARNYVYSLRRKIQELHELVDAATIARQNPRSANKIHISLVAAHQAASKALITYLKQMPYPVGVGVPDKLSELLHLIIDMCTMCSLFKIESAEIKKGPDEIEHHCQYILCRIQEQKKHHISIDVQHSKVLSMDNKKISSQKHKKKLNHYSLAMYKPTVPFKTLPKGYKNTIKNLARVKFGPVPKRHSEAEELKPVVTEHKFKRHRPEVTSPMRMLRTAKVKKPHRLTRPSQENNVEWVGKSDDSDNIITLVKLFGQNEATNDPEETHISYYAEKMREKEINQTNETIGEKPDDVTKGDSAMHTHISENADFPKGHEVKLGAPNAQLILLPPYQLSSFEQSKQFIDDQYQRSQKENAILKLGELQQRFWQQRCSKPQIALPKTVGMLHRNRQQLSNEDTNEMHKYEVQEQNNQNRTEPFQAPPACRHPSDTYLISEQSRIIDNINASISHLKTSHVDINEQISDSQNEQQQIIVAQEKLPQSLKEEKCRIKYGSLLSDRNNSIEAIYQIKPATLHVSDKQLLLVFKYVHQCENLFKTSLIHKQQLKPWNVLNMLSDQLVHTALRCVVEELDFDALLTNMYRLEFQ